MRRNRGRWIYGRLLSGNVWVQARGLLLAGRPSAGETCAFGPRLAHPAARCDALGNSQVRGATALLNLDSATMFPAPPFLRGAHGHHESSCPSPHPYAHAREGTTARWTLRGSWTSAWRSCRPRPPAGGSAAGSRAGTAPTATRLRRHRRQGEVRQTPKPSTLNLKTLDSYPHL